LTRFRIPSGTVGADEYLVIFASGKNGVRNGEIHTNFELAAEGEYVALVHPDGKTVVSELAPRYPPQRDGYGWGIVRGEIDPPLVARGSDARYLVPQDDSLGLSWTGDPDDEPFSDASWTATRLGVGYPGGGGVEPPRPLAYWTFDSGSVDATGNGHDLVRHGTSSSVDTPFGLGRSILFDGVDDYASAEIDVSETGYAVSFWFRTRARTAGLFSVVQDDLGGGGHDRHLYLTNGNIGSRVWNDETIISTGLDLADDNWHHVVHRVGLEIAGQEIWVDGSLVARGTKATSDFDWQERVNIGFSNDASPNYFNGRIDNLAVFDGVLDENAIASLFAGSDPLSLGGVTPFVESDIEADV
ncbi:MAG TPA: LamG-like jellyroll fold domain-containing protein, partial [Planctomycetota bacterium]|nr:LamG-like jellyroll fold domain-containing protein [Planctomycetota bacterium]